MLQTAAEKYLVKCLNCNTLITLNIDKQFGIYNSFDNSIFRKDIIYSKWHVKNVQKHTRVSIC